MARSGAPRWLRLARVSLDAFSLLTTLISVGDVFLCRLVRKHSGDEGVLGTLTPE